MAGSDASREQLEKILSQDEYQIYYEDNRGWLEILWDKVKSWVMDFLGNLFSLFEPSSGFGNVMVALLLVIVLALLGIVIWLVVRSARRKRAFRATIPADEYDALNLTTAGHIRQADIYHKNDDLTEATRHVFLALLLHFDELGWLEARTWKTNWDYVTEIRQVNRSGADAFMDLALVFDEVFYGEHIMKPRDYDAYRHEADKWLSSTRQTQVPEQ